MKDLKFLMALIHIFGMFSWAACDAGSITIRQTSRHQVISHSLEITYEYKGKNSTKSTGIFWNPDESRKIEIPGEAVNIHVNAYESDYSKNLIFTKFYPSPVTRCFVISEEEKTPTWFEEPCQKLPTSNRYPITVRNKTPSKVCFEIAYEYNGTNLTEASEDFWYDAERTLQIPDGVKNINLTFHGGNDRTAMYKIFYALPVKKCFAIYKTYGIYYQWFEEPCESLPATNGNLISIRQFDDSRIIFRLIYQYDGAKLSETSDRFSFGESRTIRIPDKATNITLRGYKDEGLMYSLRLLAESFFALPVRKCYKAIRAPDSTMGLWLKESESESCEATN